MPVALQLLSEGFPVTAFVHQADQRSERDFDAVYREEEDPWSIGNADSERYNLYHDTISAAAALRSSMLDIGCGFGAFLARFQGEFEELATQTFLGQEPEGEAP